MRKPRQRAVESLAQALTARKWQRWYWNSACTAHKAFTQQLLRGAHGGGICTALGSPRSSERGGSYPQSLLSPSRRSSLLLPVSCLLSTPESLIFFPPKSFSLIRSAVEYGPQNNNAKYTLCCRWISCLLSKMETLAWIYVCPFLKNSNNKKKPTTKKNPTQPFIYSVLVFIRYDS